jgi:peptidoglycan/LPS O-acetylase OafA/YrhL
VAIALVVGFHLPFGFGSLDTALLRGGFVGVDVFFVLSGFLITLVLLPPGREGPPSLRRFLARRVTRLVPAFAGLLLAAAAVGVFELAGTGAEDLWAQIGLAAAAAINWPLALGRAAPATFVSHTWSLALEWQWYVAWSLVVWAAVRAGARRQVLMYGALAGAALVAIWRSVYWSTGVAEERLYYGFDTRGLDAFLIGAVVALALQLYGPPVGQTARRATAAAALGGLATILGLALSQATRNEFWYRDAGARPRP